MGFSMRDVSAVTASFLRNNGKIHAFFVQKLHRTHEWIHQSLEKVSIEKKSENGYNIYIGNLREICYSLMGFSRK